MYIRSMGKNDDDKVPKRYKTKFYTDAKYALK